MASEPVVIGLKALVPSKQINDSIELRVAKCILTVINSSTNDILKTIDLSGYTITDLENVAIGFSTFISTSSTIPIKVNVNSNLAIIPYVKSGRFEYHQYTNIKLPIYTDSHLEEPFSFGDYYPYTQNFAMDFSNTDFHILDNGKKTLNGLFKNLYQVNNFTMSNDSLFNTLKSPENIVEMKETFMNMRTLQGLNGVTNIPLSRFTSLANVDRMFMRSGITTVPAGYFENLPIISKVDAFKDCLNMQTDELP